MIMVDNDPGRRPVTRVEAETAAVAAAAGRNKVCSKLTKSVCRFVSHERDTTENLI